MQTHSESERHVICSWWHGLWTWRCFNQLWHPNKIPVELLDIFSCPEANASSFFSSVSIPVGMAEAWSWVRPLVHDLVGLLQKKGSKVQILQKWSQGVRCFNRQLVKAKHGETHEKPSFHRPSFFLLNTILKIVILLTFGAKTGSRLFLGKLLQSSASTSLTYYLSKTPRNDPTWTSGIF